MTAEFEENENTQEHKNQTDANTTTQTEAQHIDIPHEIEEIFDFLSSNVKIVFKSQQIDDPELQRSEKIQIARELYGRNRQTFLMRFGSYLEERHLAAFANFTLSDRPSVTVVPLKFDENSEEMKLMLVDYRNKLHTRKQDVKNRRYVAMQKLIKQGEYFGEQEMMKRAPELYQELIGQYLSEAERKQRDSYDVKNTTFSGILMHTMQQQQINEVLKEVITGKQFDVDDEESTQSSSRSNCQQTAECSTNSSFDEVVDEVPTAMRQQWGNFDNEEVPCSLGVNCSTQSSQRKEKSVGKIKPKQNHVSEKFITAGERNLFRQEFIDIMYEQFLSGNDKDFDYTQVDDDAELDDLKQLNQDKEDAYFDEDSDSDGNAVEQCMEQFSSDESEDDLDVYMNHLSKHHSLQK